MHVLLGPLYTSYYHSFGSLGENLNTCEEFYAQSIIRQNYLTA